MKGGERERLFERRLIGGDLDRLGDLDLKGDLFLLGGDLLLNGGDRERLKGDLRRGGLLGGGDLDIDLLL